MTFEIYSYFAQITYIVKHFPKYHSKVRESSFNMTRGGGGEEIEGGGGASVCKSLSR